MLHINILHITYYEKKHQSKFLHLKSNGASNQIKSNLYPSSAWLLILMSNFHTFQLLICDHNTQLMLSFNTGVRDVTFIFEAKLLTFSRCFYNFKTMYTDAVLARLCRPTRLRCNNLLSSFDPFSRVFKIKFCILSFFVAISLERTLEIEALAAKYSWFWLYFLRSKFPNLPIFTIILMQVRWRNICWLLMSGNKINCSAVFH